MKIAFINDYDCTEYLGGAALVNDYIIHFLQKIGHSVTYIGINPNRNDWGLFQMSQFDMLFLANLPYLTVQQLNEVTNSGLPYIVFRHDILPCCYVEHPESRGEYALVKNLLTNSHRNFYISEVQKQYYHRIHRREDDRVIPPPIQLDGFINLNRPTRSGVIYLGPISEIRGVNEILAYQKEAPLLQKITFCGKVESNELLNRIIESGNVYIEEVSRSNVPELFNQYESLIHIPNFFDSFCVKIIEAELCGMQIITIPQRIGRYCYSMDANSLAAFMQTDSLAAIQDEISSISKNIL
jgi:glycosyltransferase involved in cell wall biosynthesis